MTDSIPLSEENLFLVAYDYGMGGLWGAFLAPSEDAIKAIYPELSVTQVRPAWMSDERYEQIVNTELHNINGAPWGILNVVLEDRAKRQR
jgi:hypothetical protein